MISNQKSEDEPFDGSRAGIRGLNSSRLQRLPDDFLEGRRSTKLGDGGVDGFVGFELFVTKRNHRENGIVQFLILGGERVLRGGGDDNVERVPLYSAAGLRDLAL